MTVALANDLTQLNAMDATPLDFNFDGGVFKSGSPQAVGFVEGTACIEIRVNDVGTGEMGINFNGTITSLGDDHIFYWLRESFEYDTFANNGCIVGIAADLGGPPNDFGAWKASGSDRSISCYDGWVRVAVNPFLAFDFTTGTPPARTSFTHGYIRQEQEAFGRDVAMFDSYDHGGIVTITSGTVAAPGKFSEIATADRAATITGGMWKDKIGLYFTTCKTVFGDVGTAESNITETNQTVVYEYNRVQGHINELECVGNSTSILNKVLFGTITGTGNDEVGSAGVNFINSGIVPNHFTATDANCDEMRLAGCNFLGPVAVYEDALMTCWSFTASSFVDETVDINDTAATSFNDTAIASYYAFGHAAQFDVLTVDSGGNAGTPVVVWEYSTGVSTWATLPDLTDGTGSLDIVGANEVTYSIPADWVEGTLNSVSRFYIRARYTTAGSGGTNLNSATVRFSGRVRLEQTNVKCISSNFTNMGTITVNNGADFKKCSIVDSVSPAKNAALDFGDTDPTADTVRDVTITGGVNGINLQGNVNTTYNFRNIQMSGQTGKKVRIEFDAGDTVTINLLDGSGAIANPGDIDNINSSTIVINNNVSLEVLGVTEGTAIKIVADETVGSVTKGDVLLTGFADSAGELAGNTINYEGAFDPSGLDVIVRARNQGIAVAAIAEDGGAFVDETTEAASEASADMTLLPTVPAANDAYNFGHDTQFSKVRVDVSTALAFSSQPTIIWEYWNGAWVSLSGVTDGTQGFEIAGDNVVSFTLPGDWATTTINGQGPLYYIRARLSVLGTITTVPVGKRATLNTQRYLPYAANRVIISGTGLVDIATWTKDNISNFEVPT